MAGERLKHDEGTLLQEARLWRERAKNPEAVLKPLDPETRATAIRIGQLVGASDVITGSLQLEGSTLVVHARGLALEAGRISHDVIERGPVSELFATFDRAARRFVPAAPPRGVASDPQPSLPAFESASHFANTTFC